MLLKTLLQYLVESKASVRIFTVNGYQMRGVITLADTSVVLLEVDGSPKLINVGAISTIEPLDEFRFREVFRV